MQFPNVVSGLREPPPRPAVDPSPAPRPPRARLTRGTLPTAEHTRQRPHRHWARGVAADRGAECERPGPRAEQNPRREVTRKCSLPPAPPTGGPPKTPRFDNVPGARDGGRTEDPQLPATRSPSPQELGLGGHSPAARPREPGEKRAVGSSSWSHRRGQPARSQAQPPG